MDYGTNINKAILAHAAWKRRLQDAINTGVSEFNVAQVQVDDRCEFGKWFYSLPIGIRQSERGKKIQKLHATFHSEAAKILDLALKGAKSEASKSIEIGSQYMRVTNQLTLELGDWKQTIDKS